MTDLPPSRTADKMMIRLPDGLRERIAESAKSRGRSMNADVIARIEASFKLEQDALNNIASLEELRRDTNARFDELDRERAVQRGVFDRIMANAKDLLGEDFLNKAVREALAEAGKPKD